MIIKGKPRDNGRQLATYLMKTDRNETVTFIGSRGVYSKTAKGALQEMEVVAAGSKATKPLYHASINPDPDDKPLTLEQWELAADRLEKALGLEGHQRIMVQHLKKDRLHMHVVWNRIDAKTMLAAHHSHSFKTHEKVARELEREFGLKRTQGVHAELDGTEKPQEKRAKTKDGMQEAKTGWKKADAIAMIAAAWNASRNGAAFKAYVEEAGYYLARGDTRDFVVIDPAGGVHSLRSGVKGLKVAEIRSRFVDLDQNKLQSVAEAKEAAKAAYPDFKATRDAEEIKRVFPTEPARPATPAPNRYITLPRAHEHALVMRNISYRAELKPPQPAPTPPTWARAILAVPSRPAIRPVVPTSRPAEPSAQAVPSSAMLDMRAKQDEQWRIALAGLMKLHGDTFSQLDTHHHKRMAGLTVDIDQRLNELNGLASRAGALFDRAERDREIAYLVAKRQRSLAEEVSRQAEAKDELRRAQAREIEEAKAKHDRFSAIQQTVLTANEKQQEEKRKIEREGVVRPPINPPQPDLEREP